jgi:hypothetical protein
MRFEWPHKFVNELMAAYERCLPQPAFVEWMEKGIEVHVRRSAASHKGWRTRKAMAKAREKP